MTSIVMGDLLRLLAVDGPVIGVGTLVALAWLIVRLESTRTENAAAHAVITKNIERVQEQLTKDIEGGRQDVRELKKDVRMLTAHLLGTKGPVG